MSAATKSSPFEPGRLVGAVCAVLPDSVRVNLPRASEPSGQWLHGDTLNHGQVGDFVVIETGRVGVFGRITEVRIAESERLKLDSGLKQEGVHPVGVVKLLATINPQEKRPRPGVSEYPKLGDRVFSAAPSLVDWVAASSGGAESESASVNLMLGHVASYETVSVLTTPERLFGRHCAILGTTGGGKSFSLARLVEQSVRYGCKLLLLDATGEFHKLGGKSVALGSDAQVGEEKVCVPYTELDENDFLALFSPSGRVQGPKIREAIRSLRIVKMVETEKSLKANLKHYSERDGLLHKERKPKEAFLQVRSQYVNTIESPGSPFDVTKLAAQVREECVADFRWGSKQGERVHSDWGDFDEAAYNNCAPLVNRITSIVTYPEYQAIFGTTNAASLFTIIDRFHEDDTSRLLRVSMAGIPTDFHAREIIVNLIGRYLLKKARAKTFVKKPLVVMLDEAHNFLNKRLGDEEFQVPLDAFDKIAKEGRKYWLTLCIATQRPRDIPEGVLSQMGTMIVHRLINDGDREVVERACGDIDRSAAAFLPTLGPGEAVIVGVDFPIPLTVQMEKPQAEPDSRGPDYQETWSKNNSHSSRT
jgi:DNA helicase HerA-like ATPase